MAEHSVRTTLEIEVAFLWLSVLAMWKEKTQVLVSWFLCTYKFKDLHCFCTYQTREMQPTQSRMVFKTWHLQRGIVRRTGTISCPYLVIL